MTDVNDIFAPDHIFEGIKAIACYLRKSERQVYYLAESGQIPAFKMAGKWCMRPRSYTEHLTKLEAENVSKAEAITKARRERAAKARENANI